LISDQPLQSPAASPAPERIDATAYVVEDVDGDGSCMFRALSSALFGSEGLHLRVRTAAVHHICRHWPQYIEEVRGEHGDANPKLLSDETNRQYKKYMSDSHAWGGLPELNAMARTYNVHIAVYKPSTTHREHELVYSTNPGGMAFVTMLYVNYNHYQALHPRVLQQPPALFMVAPRLKTSDAVG
jgi:OTU-like cysteine protease